MSVVETAPAQVPNDSYLAAVSSSSAADRIFASDMFGRFSDIIKAMAALKNRFHTAGNAEGIDVGMLLRLGKEGPMRASDLAEQLCADPSTVSRQVAGLVKAGLIERQADPHDGRASILVVTASGQARLAALMELRGQLFAPLISHWSAADRRTFFTLLDDFAGQLTTTLEPLKNAATVLLHADDLSRRNS